MSFTVNPTPANGVVRKNPSILTLQKSFLAEGDITHSPARALILRFSYQDFEYSWIAENTALVRIIKGPDKFTELSQDLGSKEYRALLPEDVLIGQGNQYAVNFLNFLYQQYSGYNELDRISLSLGLDFFSDEEIHLGSGDPIDAVFFMKDFYDASGNRPAILDRLADDNSAAETAAEFVAKNAFLVNKAVFRSLKDLLSPGNQPNTLLQVIGFITNLSSGRPMMITDLSEEDKGTINGILSNMEVADNDKALELVRSYFDRLFDFPISTASIRLQEAGGTFRITGADDVQLTPADFAMYDLSLEYSTLNEYGQSELVDVHYDWNKVKGSIKDNTVAFSFSEGQLIIPAEEHEVLTVYVRGADGMELWSTEYRAGSAALHSIDIAVARTGGGIVRPGDTSVASPKRLRGQILDMTGQKANLKDAVVVIEAKVAGNTHWHVVGSAVSDKDGYFSLPYPAGVYTAAQAVLSLMPHSPAAIAVNADKGDKRTISGDFLYLLLTAVTVPLPAAGDKEDDCDCHNTLKATRLPDQADLIHSDEYTQDLGAGCINLSTPNRTLKEYNHQAVVRTSDPDVANYTLARDEYGRFTLAGDRKKIRRRAIDLNNPIRWQDAPDTTGGINATTGEPTDNSHSNLSFYQAVTIATGHILHYKSMFKADGYSLGELLYSLPLAPGQKKQIVIFDSSHSLQGSESQQLSVSERLAANITNDRDVADQLSGSISEGLRGASSAMTAGVGAAAGVAASSGIVGGAVGVAGGYATASSDAS